MFCMFITVNGHPMKTSGVQSQHAPDSLLSIIDSNNQTIAHQTQVVHHPRSNTLLYFPPFLHLLHFSHAFFPTLYIFFPTGWWWWWCWPQVQHQRSDEGQLGDRQRVMGHCGRARSPPCLRHSSALLRKLQRCPSVASCPGPGQAEPSLLLWADQWKRQSAHGHLRPQVMSTLLEVCMLICMCSSLFVPGMQRL